MSMEIATFVTSGLLFLHCAKDGNILTRISGASFFLTNKLIPWLIGQFAVNLSSSAVIERIRGPIRLILSDNVVL